MPRYAVENSLTDNRLGVYEAPDEASAIDAAYRARGWRDFADAREQHATAAQPGEVVARQIDERGFDTGPERVRVIRNFRFYEVGGRVFYSPSQEAMETDLRARRSYGFAPREVTWAEAWAMKEVEAEPNGCRTFHSFGGAGATLLTPADLALMTEAGQST